MGAAGLGLGGAVNAGCAVVGTNHNVGVGAGGTNH